MSVTRNLHFRGKYVKEESERVRMAEVGSRGRTRWFTGGVERVEKISIGAFPMLGRKRGKGNGQLEANAYKPERFSCGNKHRQVCN